MALGGFPVSGASRAAAPWCAGPEPTPPASVRPPVRLPTGRPPRRSTAALPRAPPRTEFTRQAGGRLTPDPRDLRGDRRPSPSLREPTASPRQPDTPGPPAHAPAGVGVAPPPARARRHWPAATQGDERSRPLARALGRVASSRSARRCGFRWDAGCSGWRVPPAAVLLLRPVPRPALLVRAGQALGTASPEGQ